MKSMKITVPCPECRKSTLKPLVELETANEIVCSYCGNRIDLTKKYWQVALREALDAADKIKPKSE
jgi:DNA-directed RNA polymerase subunit RPC12/RpoP